MRVRRGRVLACLPGVEMGDGGSVMGDASSRKILVVDDDPGIRGLLTDLLGDEGYQVAVAKDGLEALTVLDARGEKPPYAILLDFTMPRCDGEEFARRYRDRQEHPTEAAPIILLTASHQVEERCALVHADACVGKPFDVGELLKTLETLTHTHQQAA